MKEKLTGKDIAKVLELVQEGIETDGGHHKQWFLVEIAKVLGIPYVTDDEGLAP